MDWLNYHHLLYFWTVAKHGTIARACQELRLAQPTISSQIRALEDTLGEKLFTRHGRHLVLTEMGRLVFRYADDIFSIGRDLLNTVKGFGPGHTARLTVGVSDVVPKLLASQLLRPAFAGVPAMHLVCWEDKLETLLADLATHRLDLVIADTPAPPSISVQTYNHLMGESAVSFFATNKLALRYRKNFPQSLMGVPVLLPTSNATLRRLLDEWMVRLELYPTVVGEFEDSATLKAFGQEGHGVFPGLTALEKEICRQYRVQVVGRVDSLKQRFYAITIERRLKHPAVVAVYQSARQELFG